MGKDYPQTPRKLPSGWQDEGLFFAAEKCGKSPWEVLFIVELLSVPHFCNAVSGQLGCIGHKSLPGGRASPQLAALAAARGRDFVKFVTAGAILGATQ